ncbi:MAG TPA: pre-peptidase C-terminal domain-containing protein, partial [Pirellulales bacterium]|nr:pre-peptidase C-terminal domain-containing protein [Pirellulales bacterium]
MTGGRIVGRMCCLLFAAAISARGAAHAQALVQRARNDLPAVTRIMPCAVQRGQTVEVTVSGERLEGLNAVLGPAGVKLGKVLAVEEKLARLELEVAADAMPGVYPFHLLAKAGLSNPRFLRIDELAQISETEDNNSPATANVISAPVGVNAVLTATDVDYYRFVVEAGQTLVFDVEANRIGSALQPVLTLFDAAGRSLARAANAAHDIAPDVRLTYTFASPGTYYLRVNDIVYAGGDFAVYHLRVGAISFATSMFPLGGRRGTKTTLTLAGGNLLQPVVHDIDLTGNVAWRRARLTVPSASGPIAAPAWFAVGDLPEFIEQEPNDETAQANRVAWPVTINGRIDREADRDLFQFHAAAGNKLNVRVMAQELGSPLDSLVTISDSLGNELLSADDRQPVPREPPLVRALVASPPIDDVLAEFIAPADGDYFVAIDDLFGFGSPAHGYRLEIAQAPQDFELLVQPGTATTPANPNA